MNPIRDLLHHSLGDLEVDDVQDQLGIFDAVLELGGQTVEVPIVQVGSVRQCQLELARQEALERGEPLQAVDHHQLSVRVLREVQDR